MLLNVSYLAAAISAGKKGQHWLQALGLWSCASDSFLPGVIYHSAVFIACKKGQLGIRPWALGIDTADAIRVLPGVISYSADQCLCRRASEGNKPWVSWHGYSKRHSAAFRFNQLKAPCCRQGSQEVVSCFVVPRSCRSIAVCTGSQAVLCCAVHLS